MNFVNYDITLDVHDTSPQLSIVVKKNDTRRKINISLSENGNPYEITKDCTAIFTGVKPDGKKLFNPCVINGNIIHYELTEQTTIVPGLLKAELRLVGGEGQVITTPRFVVVVDDVLFADNDVAEDSEEEKQAFQELLSLVKQTETRLENGDFDGVGIESVKQTTTSYEDGGENIITVTTTDGNKSTFSVRNGSKGSSGGGGGGVGEIPIASNTQLGGIKVGENLVISNSGVLSVETTDEPEQDNTKPITSAGVFTTIGNINVLLSTI